MSPAGKTALIMTAGAFAGLLGTVVGAAVVPADNAGLRLAIGLGLGLALQAFVTYQVVKA